MTEVKLIDTEAPETNHGYDFDLMVIGGGSGGLACGKAAISYSTEAKPLKVAICDFVKPSPPGTKWGLGGTCVNVGCIPKKLMHQAALLKEARSDATYFGWEGADLTHNWTTLRDNVNNHIKKLNFGYRTELAGKGIKYYNKLAKFVDAHTVELTKPGQEPEKVTARRFVVAVGGRPTYPDIPGAKEYGITSDDIFQLQRDPGKVLCIGASYVSLECAGFLTHVGKDVTVAIRSIPLRGFDQQMAGLVADYMEAHGTRLLRQCVPVKIEETGGDHKYSVTLQWPGLNKTKVEQYDTILFATGRSADIPELGLDAAGIKITDKGKIVVDQCERTSVPHIYAIGDVIEGGLELTPVAIQAGRQLAARLYAGATKLMDYINVPTTIFTPLEYGCVGYPEEDAKAKFGEDNLEVYHTNFTPLEWTLPGREDTACYCKLVCLKTEKEKVIGFHILSPNAGEITQGVALAMKLGVTKETFDDTIGIHPTVAETFTTMAITKSSGEAADTGGGC
eukprot:TRINITY_DN63758_c0_g3_i1.p1 TRINITY_DN63758_c0_g3~~TRINITY_DN63758_c0_g3_i1.p1  ORF type:complete len:507 (-),score=82.78 TRINITY_DN63758_c0_g3_i1:277-1797(-)